MFVSSPNNSMCCCAHPPAILVPASSWPVFLWQLQLVSQCTATPAYGSNCRYCTCTVAAVFIVNSLFSGVMEWHQDRVVPDPALLAMVSDVVMLLHLEDLDWPAPTIVFLFVFLFVFFAIFGCLRHLDWLTNRPGLFNPPKLTRVF